MGRSFIDIGKATLDLGPDGVICLAWQPGSNLDGVDVETAMAAINVISEGMPRPLLVEMTDVTLNRDARAAFTRASAASRVALLGSTPVDWMMANFRGRHTCPSAPHFFTDRSAALRWLRGGS